MGLNSLSKISLKKKFVHTVCVFVICIEATEFLVFVAYSTVVSVVLPTNLFSLLAVFMGTVRAPPPKASSSCSFSKSFLYYQGTLLRAFTGQLWVFRSPWWQTTAVNKGGELVADHPILPPAHSHGSALQNVLDQWFSNVSALQNHSAQANNCKSLHP